MLFSLFEILKSKHSMFNALTYLSTRAILALITGLTISTLLYPPVIKKLRSMKLGQPIRELGPASHMEKKGTPTMGGVILILSTVFCAVLWMDVTNRHFWTLLIVSLGYGSVGVADDYIKITKKNSKGISSRAKMIGLLVFGAAAVGWHMWAAQKALPLSLISKESTLVYLPFLKDFAINFSIFYFPFAMLVLIGTSNAVNLTDGLDGLVIGPVITCSIALLVLSYVTGNVIMGKYLFYHHVQGSGEIVIFLSALIGSSMGFLWFNTWPAQVFMGDSGSLPLGGILGMIAIITGHEFLLVIMGGLFVVEAGSVILQVASFKTRKKRIFLMAPIHHHFEKAGLPEQKITIRAWILSFILALFSILTLKLR